jgi:hypothetical protein
MKSFTLPALALLLVTADTRADPPGFVDRLRRDGAVAYRDDTRPGAPVYFVSMPRGTTDADLAGLCELRGLRGLDLRGTGVTDAGVRHVAELRLLEALSLVSTDVTDACLSDLAALKGLRYLDLRDTATTEGGAQRLRAALPDCVVLR